MAAAVDRGPGAATPALNAVDAQRQARRKTQRLPTKAGRQMRTPRGVFAHGRNVWQKRHNGGLHQGVRAGWMVSRKRGTRNARTLKNEGGVRIHRQTRWGIPLLTHHESESDSATNASWRHADYPLFTISRPRLSPSPSNSPAFRFPVYRFANRTLSIKFFALVPTFERTRLREKPVRFDG